MIDDDKARECQWHKYHPEYPECLHPDKGVGLSCYLVRSEPEGTCHFATRPEKRPCRECEHADYPAGLCRSSQIALENMVDTLPCPTFKPAPVPDDETARGCKHWKEGVKGEGLCIHENHTGTLNCSGNRAYADAHGSCHYEPGEPKPVEGEPCSTNSCDDCGKQLPEPIIGNEGVFTRCHEGHTSPDRCDNWTAKEHEIPSSIVHGIADLPSREPKPADPVPSDPAVESPEPCAKIEDICSSCGYCTDRRECTVGGTRIPIMKNPRPGPCMGWEPDHRELPEPWESCEHREEVECGGGLCTHPDKYWETCAWNRTYPNGHCALRAQNEEAKTMELTCSECAVEMTGGVVGRRGGRPICLKCMVESTPKNTTVSVEVVDTPAPPQPVTDEDAKGCRFRKYVGDTRVPHCSHEDRNINWTCKQIRGDSGGQGRCHYEPSPAPEGEKKNVLDTDLSRASEDWLTRTDGYGVTYRVVPLFVAGLVFKREVGDGWDFHLTVSEGREGPRIIASASRVCTSPGEAREFCDLEYAAFDTATPPPAPDAMTCPKCGSLKVSVACRRNDTTVWTDCSDCEIAGWRPDPTFPDQPTPPAVAENEEEMSEESMTSEHGHKILRGPSCEDANGCAHRCTKARRRNCAHPKHNDRWSCHGQRTEDDGRCRHPLITQLYSESHRLCCTDCHEEPCQSRGPKQPKEEPTVTEPTIPSNRCPQFEPVATPRRSRPRRAGLALAKIAAPFILLVALAMVGLYPDDIIKDTAELVMGAPAWLADTVSGDTVDLSGRVFPWDGERWANGVSVSDQWALRIAIIALSFLSAVSFYKATWSWALPARYIARKKTTRTPLIFVAIGAAFRIPFAWLAMLWTAFKAIFLLRPKQN